MFGFIVRRGKRWCPRASWAVTLGTHGRQPAPPSPTVLRRRRAAADAAVLAIRQAYTDTLSEPLPEGLASLLRQLEVPH